MTLLSSIYDISSRGNIRGKAKAGFIRPTTKQFFTSENWQILPASIFIGYSENRCIGGTANASSTESSYSTANYAFDYMSNYGWYSADVGATFTEWLQYDFGNDTTRIITRYSIGTRWAAGGSSSITNWIFQGSNNANDWYNLDTVINSIMTQPTMVEEIRWYNFNSFENNTPYRYYRLYITGKQNNIGWATVWGLKMFESIYS